MTMKMAETPKAIAAPSQAHPVMIWRMLSMQQGFHKEARPFFVMEKPGPAGPGQNGRTDEKELGTGAELLA